MIVFQARQIVALLVVPLAKCQFTEALPRYGEIWRDKLVKKGLMMSIEEHLNYSSRKIGVNAWIYEKPTGVYYQIWIVSVSIISVLATVGIVNLSNAIFTIR